MKTNAHWSGLTSRATQNTKLTAGNIDAKTYNLQRQEAMILRLPKHKTLEKHSLQMKEEAEKFLFSTNFKFESQLLDLFESDCPCLGRG